MPGPWAMHAPDGLADGATHPQPQRPVVRAPAVARPGAAPGGRIAVGLANAVLAQLPLAVAVITADCRLVYWNEAAVNLFGMPPVMAAEMPSLRRMMSGVMLLTEQQRENIVEFVAAQIATGNGAFPDSCLRLTIERERRIIFQVLGLSAGRWMLVVDDGFRVAASRQVASGSEAAWLDPLTGLGNRRYFNEALRDTLHNATADSRHAVLAIDLDRFRAVNDTLGKSAGDALLCLVARRLRHETRDDDLLVRLGSDEFVVLLSSASSDEALAERVVDVVARPFLVEGHIANIGCSVGIARFPEHGNGADNLMHHAELALNDAKTAGGGRWRLFATGMRSDTTNPTSLK